MISRRLLQSVSGLTLVVLVLSGCGGAPTDTSAPVPPTASPTAPPPIATPTPIPYELSLFVMGEGGAPIVGAIVMVAELGEDEAATRMTDCIGEVSWTDLPGHKLHLTISAQGYSSKEKTLIIERGPNGILVSLERDTSLNLELLDSSCTSAPSPARQVAVDSHEAVLNAQAVALHKERRLSEASTLYQQVLELSPPAQPDAAQVALALHYAPRLYTTPTEYFRLEDIVVVLHPERPIIAYHLFWDDDIDYPEDNDPTDHEVVWIEFDPATEDVVQVYAYFHGDILQTQDAAAETNAHDGRAWIGVEWGKHGSLPWDAAGLESGLSTSRLRENWQRLHTAGIRRPEHPFARDWPHEFRGDWEDYRDFTVLVDPVPMLEERQMIIVSRWGNAILDQYFLPYNFYPKPEWP